MLEGFVDALSLLTSGPILLYALLGTVLGLLFGALPGLGGAAALALLIPISFGWDSNDAFMLLASSLGGISFGGSLTAILVNTPGTAGNAASLLDGYPMTQQGRSGEAIGISATASTLGSLVGLVLLVALLPVSREMILAFSYPEMFMISLVGLSMIALVSSGSMLKGVVGGGLGLVLSFVGRSPITGEQRFTFDTTYLQDGVPLIPAIIGFFAMAEGIRILVVNRGAGAGGATGIGDVGGGAASRWGGIMRGVGTVFRYPRIFAQSSLIGTVTGIVPGVGGSVAGFIAYAGARQSVKDPSQFGRGDARGLLAVEASNDAKDGGAVLPTILFGLPGSPAWAVMLGALLVHGIAPGREMLTSRMDVTWIIIVGLLFSSIVSSLIGLSVAPWLSRIVTLPTAYITPVIFVLGFIGAYAARGRIEDVYVVIVAGLAGYALKATGFSLITIVIGMVLGRTLETTLGQTLLLYGWEGFFQRPLSLGILIAGALIVAVSLWKNRDGSLSAEDALQPKEGGDA